MTAIVTEAEASKPFLTIHLFLGRIQAAKWSRPLPRRLLGFARAAVEMTPEQKKKFVPLCPVFVVELLSPTDSLVATQAKMVEYLDNGARLGWLIHPEAKRVYIYRPGAAIKELKDPTYVSADPELPGFTLDLQDIWKLNI